MPLSIENLCPDFLAFWEQARAGYVVGYRMVQRLAQTCTVAEMARWQLDRVHQELRAVLTLEGLS